MLERTLVFVKPDHMLLYVPILAMVDPLGNRVGEGLVDKVPKDKISAHYLHLQSQGCYDILIEHFVEKSIFLAVYEGEGIVQKILDVSGPTDPSQAGSNTIRGKFSGDSLEKSRAEGRIVRNVLHRSNSPEDAMREIKIWESYINWK